MAKTLEQQVKEQAEQIKELKKVISKMDGKFRVVAKRAERATHKMVLHSNEISALKFAIKQMTRSRG